MALSNCSPALRLFLATLIGLGCLVLLSRFLLLLWTVVRVSPLDVLGYDWHVYEAASRQLAEGTLYSVPLTSDRPLPLPVFNQMPIVGFLATGIQSFGTHAELVWLLAQAVSFVTGLALALRALLRNWIGWLSVYLVLWSVTPWFNADLLLGNINGFMTLLIGSFVALHMAGRQRSAGVVLGAAAAIKLWPIAFIPLLLRDRRRAELLGFAIVFGALTLGLTLVLGFDRLLNVAEALRHEAIVDDSVPIFWMSALRRIWDWWPMWGGALVGTALVLIPAKSRLGLGLAIMGGLSAVPNLWHHYLPTVAISAALLSSPLVEFAFHRCVCGIQWMRSSSGGLAGQVPPDGANGRDLPGRE